VTGARTTTFRKQILDAIDEVIDTAADRSVEIKVTLEFKISKGVNPEAEKGAEENA